MISLAVLNALVAAEAAKDKGYRATVGAHFASKRTHKHYLREHHLGKFAKGK